MVSPAQMAIALISLAVVVLLFVFFEGEQDDAPDVGNEAALETNSSRAIDTDDGMVPVIQVENGKPVGGQARLQFEQGERARFVVGGDRPEEVHVHGYDISAQLGPGRPAELSFPADLTGVFEVELERSETLIAELEVRP